MKRIFIILLLCLSDFFLYAQQAPQHVQDCGYDLSQWVPFVFDRQATNGPVKQQTFYLTSEFPGASNGLMTSIYFKCASKITEAEYRNFTIMMGYMPKKEGGGSADTLYYDSTAKYPWYPADTVFYSPLYQIKNKDTGDWIKFSFQKPFVYDPAENFTLMLYHDSMIYTRIPPKYNYPMMAQAALPINNTRGTYILPGFSNPNTNFATSGFGHVIFLGFDLQPNSIQSIPGISGFNLYPNPSSGRFQIRLDAQKEVQRMEFSVSSITGNTVHRQQFKNVQGSFSRQIDLSGLAPGVYFATIATERGKEVRKLIIR